MTEQQIKTAVFAWATAATGWTGTQVIWAHPNIPRPALDYLSLQILATRSRGQAAQVVESDGDAVGHYWQEVSIQIQAYGSTALDKLATLRLSLQGLVARAAFNAAGLYRRGIPEISKIPAIAGTDWEHRARMTVAFGYLDTLTEQPGWIDVVDYTLTVYDEAGDLSATVQVDVDEGA